MFLTKTSLPMRKVITTCSIFISIIASGVSVNAFSQNLSGQIIDNHGNPIKFATIKINGREKALLSNEQGLFTFTGLEAGSIELHASAKNFTHDSHHVNLKKDDIADVVMVLSPSVMEVLDVYATPLHSSTIESALPVNVISGDDLKLKQASTLGETLKNEVGVHSSFYGSVASSPIIRGLDGPRVLITQNGLDAGDASRVGADHAVATETSTATQIEVLRGPATLFYGSGAIGGVVNVVDNRVPKSTDTLAEWLLQYNDVANEQQASFALQKGVQIAGENFALHLDGFYRDGENYKLPNGFEEESHEEEEHEEDEEHHEEADTDTLENSASKSSGLTLGSSYIFDNGFVGFSYGSLTKDYGIPGHAHHEEDEHEEGNLEEHGEEHDIGTQAKMKQDRVQFISDIKFDNSAIKQLATKFAYTDYQHQEIEAGLVGTTFSNKSLEFKTDVYHQDYLGWQGAWTFHYKGSDFSAIGDEAFTPPSNTDSLAFAWLEEKHFGPVLLQLGARIEHVTLDVLGEVSGFSHEEHEEEHDDEHEQSAISLEQQKFSPVSFSAGLVWDYQQGYNIGASIAFSQRAPSAPELFSFGPHIGTNTFEVGALFELEQEGDELHLESSLKSPELESSYSLDLTWRKFEGDFGFVLSAFYNHVKDYYYQQDTGLYFDDAHDEHEVAEEDHEDHGLPILIYQQDDVDMYGMEAELVYQIASPLKITLFGDYINAKLSDGSYLPRTPPMRLGTSLHYQGNNFDSEISANHYFKQSDIAPLESVTDAYTLLDMNINYYIEGVGNDMVLYAKGQNLTDEVAHVHSSFLKDIAPLPGRNFSIGIRASF